MIKIAVASRRRAGMTREEHLRYFEFVHGAKVLGAGSEVLGNIARYAQNHVLDSSYGKSYTGPDFDSVGELWFADEAALHGAMSNPYTIETIRPDEPKFSDSASLLVALVREERLPVRTPTNSDTKLMHFIFRQPDVDSETFVKRWRKFCTALVQSEELGDKLRRLAVNLPLSPPAGAPPPSCDGISSLWIDRGEHFAVLEAYEQYLVAAGRETGTFIDTTRSFVLLVKEVLIHPIAP